MAGIYDACGRCRMGRNRPIESALSRQLSIVIVGHGSIANYVVDQIRSDPGICILALLCRSLSLPKAERFANGEFPVYKSLDKLDTRPDLLVDCAGHSGLASHAPLALERGIDVVSISTGALAQPELLETLEASARYGGSTIKFLSGAVGGLDALLAAGVGGYTQVRYTGRKPPYSWSGSPADKVCDLNRLDTPFEHFSGTARQAAKLYPANANVAATVALASVGLDKVTVRLIADPGIERNIHEIEAAGSFGHLNIRIEGNALPENPKSSALAAMSIVNELRQRIHPIQF